jgi:NADPH-dependent glutamate synthase beta subunit-like oxidoreductase
VKLNTYADPTELVDAQFDSVVLATGVAPRPIDIPIDDDAVSVVTYDDVLRGTSEVGDRVAIIGAGGIGFDVVRTRVGLSRLYNQGNKPLNRFALCRPNHSRMGPP